LYRLNTFPLHIPPLRERREDIRLLARHFLELFSQTYLKKAIKAFSPEAEAILCAYEWKGNCRELKNMVERIVVLENTETILPEHLPGALTKGQITERRDPTAFILPEKGISLGELEKDLIEQALKRTNNNQTKAAKLLSISYDSLRYQIKKFGIG